MAKVTLRTQCTSGYEKHLELCLTHTISKALAITIKLLLQLMLSSRSTDLYSSLQCLEHSFTHM